jgi:hypothetical protein
MKNFGGDEDFPKPFQPGNRHHHRDHDYKSGDFISPSDDQKNEN